MNAKQILMDIANECIGEFPNVKMYFQNNLEDYDSCLKMLVMILMIIR